ncbi:MAG: VacJ family lipoprotein [Pseudomonadota bacterium]|jgi:phospholipid-binding lipoprotein MlaA
MRRVVLNFKSTVVGLKLALGGPDGLRLAQASRAGVVTAFLKLSHAISVVVLLGVVVSAPNAWCAPEEPYDPIEPVNRAIFDFNDTLDIHVLEPVARAYRNNMPDPVRIGIGNFFDNLRYPSYLVSDIIQGKFEQALDHTGRFLINTTVGVLGFMDIAKDWGLPDHREDFALGLAYHGVPAGPYLVIPFLGPSSVRDGVGLIVDGFLDPIGWVGYTSLSSGTKVAIAASALGIKVVHTRSGLLQAIEAAKEGAVDYYLFAQGAYYQHRHGLLTDGKEEEEEEQFNET